MRADEGAKESSKELNSIDYWNDRFRGDWQSKGGREQTAFFAELALNASPAVFLQDVRNRSLSICDWGCALGDGTSVMARSFPGSATTGYDISPVAISEAGNLFPALKFVAGDLFTSDRTFDVIFCSNVLEHFHHPTIILDQLASHAARYVWALIPFMDRGTTAEHVSFFEYTNIPTRIGSDFVLSHFDVLDVSRWHGSRWAGRQCLLIYAKASELRHLALNDDDRHLIGSARPYPSGCLRTSVLRMAEADLRWRASVHEADSIRSEQAGLRQAAARTKNEAADHADELARLRNDILDICARYAPRPDGSHRTARAENNRTQAGALVESVVQTLQTELRLAEERCRSLQDSLQVRDFREGATYKIARIDQFDVRRNDRSCATAAR